MSGESWHSIWERKGAGNPAKQSFTEDELFAANGYDTPLGITGIECRREMLRSIVRSLMITPQDSVLDVGCGSGAILSMLRSTGARLAGVDFSASLVEVAARCLDGLDIRISEAAALPFSSREFDAVLSFGVFLYFPDFGYANAALAEMLRVCRAPARLMIGDVPDLSKKESCVAARRAAGASLIPEHLYYPKRFFEDFAEGHSLRVSIVDQDLPGYSNSPFRYNVIFR